MEGERNSWKTSWTRIGIIYIYIYIEMKRVVRSMGKQVDWVFFLSFIRALKLDSYQKDFFSPLHFYFYFYFNSVSLSHR